MKYSNYFAITMLCALTSGASADSEAPPTPKVFAAPWNSFYFKLIPSPDFDEDQLRRCDRISYPYTVILAPACSRTPLITGIV